MVSEEVKIIKSYFPDTFERPDYNGKFYRMAKELREHWKAEWERESCEANGLFGIADACKLYGYTLPDQSQWSDCSLSDSIVEFINEKMEQQPQSQVKPHEVWRMFPWTKGFSERFIQRLIDFIESGVRADMEKLQEKHDKFKQILHPAFDYIGCPQFEGYDCRVVPRTEWMKANWRQLTPVEGPPDLDGVDDDALVLVKWTTLDFPSAFTASHCRKIQDSFNRYDGVDWSMILGAITPPKPEPPKCPWCGRTMSIAGKNDTWWMECGCGAESPAAATESAAIEAAARKGES